MRLQTYHALNALKQASKLKLTVAELPHSAFLVKILIWLVNHGYIHNFQIFFKENLKKKTKKLKSSFLKTYIRVYLKYFKSGKGLLTEMEVLGRISKTKIFKFKGLKRTQGSVVLLSTSHGILTLIEAQRLGIGGHGIIRIHH